MVIPPQLLALMAAAAVILIFLGLSLRRSQDEVQARLETLASQARNLEELELQQPFTVRVLKPIVSSFASIITKRTPAATVDQLRQRLVIAGNPSNLDVGEFLLLKVLIGILLGGIVFAVMLRAGNAASGVFFGAITVFFGWYFPNIWLSSKIGQRKKALIRALPDALDLLTISVEAGLGFDSALNKVCDKWDNALTKEFRRVLAEMRMGKSRRDAMRDLANRTDVPDINTFVSAIIQADQLGVSITNVLHVQADQMRVRRRQRAEEAAHKAPVKMIFPMALLIFPALYVIILGPSLPAMLAGFGMAK